MRVLVCGGRNYEDYTKVASTLGALHRKYPIECLIHGGCRGADKLALEWARRNKVAHKEYAPDWQAKGRAAGPLRNQRMIDDGKPDVAVAFKGGRGTADMVGRLKAANIPVWETK